MYLCFLFVKNPFISAQSAVQNSAVSELLRIKFLTDGRKETQWNIQIQCCGFIFAIFCGEFILSVPVFSLRQKSVYIRAIRGSKLCGIGIIFGFYRYVFTNNKIRLCKPARLKTPVGSFILRFQSTGFFAGSRQAGMPAIRAAGLEKFKMGEDLK